MTIQYMIIYEMEAQHMFYALAFACKNLKIEVEVEFL